MKTKNPQIDAFLNDAPKWHKEMVKLRKILLSCHLSEELKWGKPCYMFEESNVVIILPLKNYCTLLFCKGALLKDDSGILIKAGENTQAARQIRLTSLREINEKEAVLKAYIHQAIEVEKAGLEVVYKKPSDFVIPEEFKKRLSKSSALKSAFKALTPGRQRGYIMFFSAAKQSKTREARIEKCLPQILAGKGLNDR
jgi:uncharacterized protein YdeI (YjbR/CyaY-like superfamily)